MKEKDYKEHLNEFSKIGGQVNGDSPLIQDEEEDLEQYVIDGKVNEFKKRMMKDINYLDSHYIKSTILKIIIGFILLALPFLAIIILNSIGFVNKNQFLYFPYFISVSVYIGALLILLVIKLGEGCKIYGIFIYTWERKNLLKILNSIIIGFFLIWLLFANENFLANFPLMKEKVTQTNNSERTCKLFYQGTYSLRILFILLLWDLETENDSGDYIHTNLGFFEYDDENLLHEFHRSLNILLVPILFLCLYLIIKIIFIKTKKEILYLILYSLIIFECCFFIFYPINNNEENNSEYYDEIGYFSKTGSKYVEFIIYMITVGILIYLSFKSHISDLLRKKFYPNKTKENKKFINIVVLTSFCIIILGYTVLVILLIILTFSVIDESLTINTYMSYWFLIYFSLILLAIGYSFIYGNYCLSLIYYSTSYEISPHLLKNEFYIKCSDRQIDNNGPRPIKYHSAKNSKAILPVSKKPKELREMKLK